MAEVIQLEESFDFHDLSDQELYDSMTAVLQEIRIRKAEVWAIANELSRRGRPVNLERGAL